MRGRTTQKRVSSTRKPSAALRSISADTITVLWSGERPTDLTVPMSTDLCLILVLPASMPSPETKRMVIVGPCSQKVLSAMKPPTRAATMGTIQMNCSERGPGLRSTACGMSSCSAMRLRQRVPGEPRIEAVGGEHGEDHHRGEEHRAGARHDGGEGLQLDQRHERRAHEDIDHRPAPDVVRRAVDPGALQR